MVVAMLLLPLILSAQETTFTVTVANKTSEHPYYQQGASEGFVIDGVQGKELTLVRGTTYTFQSQGIPSFHPFYISTSEKGAGAGTYSAGVTGNGAWGSRKLVFTPGESTPDLLWYQCQTNHLSHNYMGWKLNIVDGTASVDESPLGALSARLSDPMPNPASGQTSLTLQVERPQQVRVVLYGMRGEIVAKLHDGMVGGSVAVGINTSELSEGVYTCVASGETFTTSRRVIVVR